MNRKSTHAAGKTIAQLLVVILGALSLIQTAGAQQDAKPAKFPIHADDIAFGDPSAPLDMIIYTSPTCAHCVDFHLAQVQYLQSIYVETGLLYLIFRPVVRVQQDLEYSLISVCSAELAGAEGYVSAVDKLSTGIKKREGAYAADLKGPEKVKALLADIYDRPADRKAMTACTESKSPRVALQRNTAELGKLTDPAFPAFVIDDQQAIFGPYPAAIKEDNNLYKRLNAKLLFCTQLTAKRTCR